MDSDPALEEVLLFSTEHREYPEQGIYESYYVILDRYTKEVQYRSPITVSNDLGIQLEDRDRDGKFELYRKYLKDGSFKLDRKGMLVEGTWLHDSIEFDKKVVVAYLTSWKEVLPDPRFMTHINYAFGHVNDSFDGVRIDREERLRTVVELKKRFPSLKVLLSLGGWGSGNFSEMAADPQKRKRFAVDCQRVVVEFGLDGIDVDWEYPGSSLANISSAPEDTANFSLLMKDIREAIGPYKLLTLASAATARYIDFKAIMPFVDFVNIMAYDMGMPPSHHHSALFPSKLAGEMSSEQAVDAHIKAGVPLDKLVLGMPLYGKGDREKVGETDYKSLLRQTKYEVQWDEGAKVSYLVDSNGEMVFTFETPESLELKCRYILERDLLGGMYWSYESDDAEGAMIKTIHRILIKREP